MTTDAKHRNILIIGAGVIGLTTGIRLAEAKHAVTIVAQETPKTILCPDERDEESKSTEARGTYTSSGSGGLWMPFLLQGEKIETWSTATFHEYEKETAERGVRMMEAILLSANREPDLPWYAELTKMRIVYPSEDERIPPEYRAARLFTAPIVHMDVYLPYLQNRAENLGIDIKLTSQLVNQQSSNGNNDDGVGQPQNTISENPLKWDLTRAREYARELYGEDAVIVNCTGIGAGSLSDEEMIPGRGVTARVRRPNGKNYAIQEDGNDGIISHDGLLAYCIPRGEEEYTLGGTIFKGDWNESVNDIEVRGVVQRATSLLQIQEDEVEIMSVWTGLRPMTTDGEARVGIQEGSGGDSDKDKEVDGHVDGHVDGRMDIIANYGHGGSGVTICWGCADEIVSIIQKLSSDCPAGRIY